MTAGKNVFVSRIIGPLVPQGRRQQGTGNKLMSQPATPEKFLLGLGHRYPGGSSYRNYTDPVQKAKTVGMQDQLSSTNEQLRALALPACESWLSML